MAKKLGLPYMGSKRDLASKILDVICELYPNANTFYDLFGGGGAVCFEALQRQKFNNVVYNEINTAITSLLIDIRDNGIRDKYYAWISRDDFHRIKTGSGWKAGLVQSCWSFGNNAKNYLFSKKIERYKEIYHNVCVYRTGDLQEMAELARQYVLEKHGIDKLPVFHYPVGDTVNERRLNLRRQITSYRKDCQLEQLEALQQLQHLERLQQLEHLEIHNSSYDEIQIKDNSIIYLDPPYKGSAKYAHDLDHDKLKQWIHKQKSPVFVSGYDNIYDLYEIESFDHRSTLSPFNNSKRVGEKVFCNYDLKVQVETFFR